MRPGKRPLPERVWQNAEDWFEKFKGRCTLMCILNGTFLTEHFYILIVTSFFSSFFLLF